MKRSTFLLSATALLATLLTGCNQDAGPQNRGVYLLMDTSGTYTKELNNAVQLINVILIKLEPGDSFAVARIDTGSFSEKDIISKMTFDTRPSAANQQKRKFREKIDKFIKTVKPASLTAGIIDRADPKATLWPASTAARMSRLFLITRICTPASRSILRS